MPHDPNSVTEKYKIGIHIRGQSSRSNPKRPFAIKMYDYDANELKSMLLNVVCVLYACCMRVCVSLRVLCACLRVWCLFCKQILMNVAEKDYSLFGFAKQDKYVLYSAYVDPSLIRNQMAFELSRSMGQYH